MKAALMICGVAVGLACIAASAQETPETEKTEHVELDSTTIRSSTELPSVMAVVPWKKALPADLGGRPDKSLVESVLTPLDPEVFKLQLKFYEQLFIGKASTPDGGDQSETGEK